MRRLALAPLPSTSLDELPPPFLRTPPNSDHCRRTHPHRSPPPTLQTPSFSPTPPQHPPACDLRRSPPFPDACTPGFQGHQGHPSTTTPADEPLTHSALLPNPRPTILSPPSSPPPPPFTSTPASPPPKPTPPPPPTALFTKPRRPQTGNLYLEIPGDSPPPQCEGGGSGVRAMPGSSSWSSGAGKKKKNTG